MIIIRKGTKLLEGDFEDINYSCGCDYISIGTDWGVCACDD